MILFVFIYFNWRLITLQYCGGFCHTLTWISHGCTCVPHCLSKRNKSLCSQVIHGQFVKTGKKIINYKTTKTAWRDAYWVLTLLVFVVRVWHIFFHFIFLTALKNYITNLILQMKQLSGSTSHVPNYNNVVLSK